MKDAAAVTLGRPAGPEDLVLVEASGWRRWPSRVFDQPISYPVLNDDHEIRVARDWSVKACDVGHVTRFQVRRQHLEKYDVEQVDGQPILAYWIPAERLEELDHNILGNTEVLRIVR